MQLFVKTLNGKTITLDVELEDKVENLKMDIQEREGIPMESIILLYQNKILEDETTVREAGIVHEARVMVIFKNFNLEGN